MPHASSHTTPQLILLGASNLTRGIATVIETARRTLDVPPGDPLDVRLAYGHGRSFGKKSTVLLRTLPGILDSGLFDDLEASSSAPTYALITDIGNDVMYGVEPQRIAEWIETCLDRLQASGARIVVTSLPMERIRRLRAWEYAIVKGLMFPRHPITHDRAIDLAGQVDGLVKDLASRRGVALFEPKGEWYGLDPIHIRRSMRTRAWAETLAGWRERERGEAVPGKGSLSNTFRLRRTMPRRWWLLRTERINAAAVCRLPDSTTVAMY